MAARPGPGEAKLGVPTDARVQEVAPAVVGGLLPRIPDCARRGEPYPAGAAAGTAAAWLTARAVPDGRTVPPSVGGRFGEADAARAEQLLRLPADVQLDWYRRTVESLGRCGTPPPDDTPPPGGGPAGAAAGTGTAAGEPAAVGTAGGVR